MKIIETIKQIRKEQGYTQTQMANLLNIAQTTYASIENNRIQLKVEDFIKICNFLNLDIANFNTNENEINLKLSKKEIETLKTINKKIDNSLKTYNYIHQNDSSDIQIGDNNTIRNSFNKK